MCKITSIQQQVKNLTRYSIFIDGKYSFSLSEQGLLDSKIAVGDEVDKQKLNELKDTSLTDKAYGRVLNLLARRARSEWELRDYLKRMKVDASVADQVIEKLVARGYVNDADFAKRWVENRRLLKPTSKRKLWQELKIKRISDDIIDQVLQDEEQSERKIVLELAMRKSSQSRYSDPQKLMQYLSRQGFNYDDIKWALENLNNPDPDF